MTKIVKLKAVGFQGLVGSRQSVRKAVEVQGGIRWKHDTQPGYKDRLLAFLRSSTRQRQMLLFRDVKSFATDPVCSQLAMTKHCAHRDRARLMSHPTQGTKICQAYATPTWRTKAKTMHTLLIMGSVK